MMSGRLAETGHVIPLLTLTEVFPLFPFLMGRDAMRVIEVGGNVGLWCEAFFDVYGDRVADYRALEPLPGNLARFRERLGWIPGAGKVTLHPVCAGEAARPVTLHYDREVTALASILLPQVDLGGMRHENPHSVEVDQVPLDDLVTGPVDLVKIDTEGHEWHVLEGARASLAAGSIDNLLLEFGFHQNALGQTFRQFHDLFRDYGYHVFRQDCDGRFFGFHPVESARWYDETRGRQYMLLATRRGLDLTYRGPSAVREPPPGWARAAQFLADRLASWRRR